MTTSNLLAYANTKLKAHRLDDPRLHLLASAGVFYEVNGLCLPMPKEHLHYEAQGIMIYDLMVWFKCMTIAEIDTVIDLFFNTYKQLLNEKRELAAT